MNQTMIDIAMGKRNDVTAGDMVIKQTQLQNAALKPIDQIHGRLRTQAGKDKLMSTVEKVSRHISSDISEKAIQKQLEDFRKMTDSHLQKQAEAENEARRNMSKSKNVNKNVKKQSVKIRPNA